LTLKETPVAVTPSDDDDVTPENEQGKREQNPRLPAAGSPQLPRGYEWGGFPDPERSDPAFLVELEIKTPVGGMRGRVSGSREVFHFPQIAFMAIFALAILASAFLCTVTVPGGIAAMILIAAAGAMTWRKL
jgi:hypothetical protein